MGNVLFICWMGDRLSPNWQNNNRSLHFIANPLAFHAYTVSLLFRMILHKGNQGYEVEKAGYLNGT